MRKLFASICVVSLAWVSTPAAEIPKDLREAQRIAFLGDSITQGGDYVVDFECFLLANGLTNQVINLGLASETASDLTAEENQPHKSKYGFGRPNVSERLTRAISAVKPDLLVVCYGMNDGDNLPAGKEGTERFAKACDFIRSTASQLGVKKIVFCTPPVFDARGKQSQHEDNITAYADWLMSKRADGWTIADIHGPMAKGLAEGRAKDPNFKYAGDGVHPGREGHWLMARAVIEALTGEKLDGVSDAAALFQKNGSEIRKLVRDRCSMLHGAWMTKIGHTRRGVAGGPGAKSGVPVDEAMTKAAETSAKIAELLK